MTTHEIYNAFKVEFAKIEKLIQAKQRKINYNHKINVRDKLHEPTPTNIFADPAANFGAGAVKELFKSPFRALDAMTGYKITDFAASKTQPKEHPILTQEEIGTMLGLFANLCSNANFSRETMEAKNMIRSIRDFLPEYLHNEFR